MKSPELDARRWAKISEDVVLQALLTEHPEPRAMLVELRRLKDPEDFSFIYEGTISALKRDGLITELSKKKATMFRRFRLTTAGLGEATKRSEPHKRTEW